MNRELLFIAAVLVASYLQRRYFDAIAAEDSSVQGDVAFGENLRGHPLQVISLVWHEVPHRLRALLRRQTNRGLELRRWAALLAILLMLLCFAWIGVVPD
jgi:hypothetical protein